MAFSYVMTQVLPPVQKQVINSAHPRIQAFSETLTGKARYMVLRQKNYCQFLDQLDKSNFTSLIRFVYIILVNGELTTLIILSPHWD